MLSRRAEQQALGEVWEEKTLQKEKKEIRPFPYHYTEVNLK